MRFNGIELEITTPLYLDELYKNFYHAEAMCDNGLYYALSIDLDRKTVLDAARLT